MGFNEKKYWDNRIKKHGVYATGTIKTILYNYSDELKWKIFEREILKKNKGKKLKILDVGCGYGKWSVKLAKLGHDVVGVDVSQESISNAKKLAKKENVEVKFLTKGGQELDFKSNSFDLVISITAIQHIVIDKEWQFAIQQFNKFLTKNGLVFLIESAPTYKKKQKLEYKAERTFKSHISQFTKSGFSLINSSGTMFTGYKAFWVIDLIIKPKKIKEKIQTFVLFILGGVDYILSYFRFLTRFEEHKMMLFRKK